MDWWRSRNDRGRSLRRPDAYYTGRVGAWSIAGRGVQPRHQTHSLGPVLPVPRTRRRKRKANLRLDQEWSSKSVRDGRRAIAPGDLDASELYQRITAEDVSERMPPVKSGKTLSAIEVQRIGRWITEGAKWEPHWSFVVPKSMPIPLVRDQSWPRNPIDAFVLARLEREGLPPASETERGILIRRVTLDLTGLPPTLAEIQAFENDNGPNAYEKVVDRLLSSPAVGERLASQWLNAARYADTSGYQTDGPRIMWRWRDWVIDAYNRNMPFDQFTIEQLAGDLLPAPTLEQKLATGFNRNHRGNSEGGIIPEEYAVEYVVDRVDTTATVWLGLTLACARCHSHKFDPITQEDFFKFFAYFNNVPENGRAIKLGNSPPMIKTPTRGQREKLDRLRVRLDDLERQARRASPKSPQTRRAGSRPSASVRPSTGFPKTTWSPVLDWKVLWSQIRRGDGANPTSATASLTTREVQPDRPSRSTAVGSWTPATSPASASSTSSHSAPGSRQTEHAGVPSSRERSKSPTERVTPPYSTKERSRSTS